MRLVTIVFVLVLLCLMIALTITLGGTLVAYLFSRAFLVVESFISVRSLPAGAYDTVSWIDNWPHIA